MKAFYICDKKACGNNHDCNKHECMHTSKIEHAANFAKTDGENYRERIPYKMVIDFKVSLMYVGKIDEFIEKRIIPLQKKYPYVEIHIEVTG